jgi:hypothetical protein
LDESEKLITIAALGNPSSAKLAWDEWKETKPLSLASPILIWAGGYIHNNLKLTGQVDPYLAGISRHNLVTNNLRLLSALPILKMLDEEFGIVPLKSFSLSTQDFAWGFRPVADFDFYSNPNWIAEIWDFLHNSKLEALMGVSKPYFLKKLFHLRGSWNFKSTNKIDLDLHWRLFDHLSIEQNTEILQRELIVRKSELGFAKFLSPELDLVLLANHYFLQGENRFNGIFDIFHQAKNIDVSKTASLLLETKTTNSFQKTFNFLEEVLGDQNQPQLVEVNQLLQKLGSASPLGTPRKKPRYFQPVDKELSMANRQRHSHLYRFWTLLGRHASLEKLLIKLFGPLSEFTDGKLDGLDLLQCENVGFGWHYRYPNNNFLWAHAPDARVALRTTAKLNYQIELKLDEEFWTIAPVSGFEIFVNGHFLETCRKDKFQFNWVVRSPRDFLELSIRSLEYFDFRQEGSDFNWYRMSAPFKSISAKVLPFG